MDFSSLNKLEFENLNIDEKEKQPSSQEELIDFSCRVVGALNKKKEKHNEENPDNQVSIYELKKVFKKGAENCRGDKTCNQLGMARVSMFLRMKDGDMLISEISTPVSFSEVRTDSLIDISDYMHPSEEDFLRADKDIEKLDLNFDFNSSEELYLEDESSFGVIMGEY